MFDAHAHLEDDKFNPDREAVVLACRKKLRGVVTVCCQPDEFERALELGRRFPNFVFPAAGLHPEWAEKYSEQEKENYFEQIRKHARELVAIGETGLDYHWIKTGRGRETQERWFRESIALARELRKPLVIHSRLAHEETARILIEEKAKQVHWHLFSAKQLLPTAGEHGWMVSIGASILRSDSIKRIARDVPLDRLLTETDSPYVAPILGQRNTPLAVEGAIAAIAAERGIPIGDVDKATTENALRFFGIKRNTER